MPKDLNVGAGLAPARKGLIVGARHAVPKLVLFVGAGLATARKGFKMISIPLDKGEKEFIILDGISRGGGIGRRAGLRG